VRILSLKDIRKETGLTQKVFAKKYHIPIRTLQDWEQERRRTPPYVIFMLKTIQEYEKKHKRYRIRKIKK
jgi:putative transcriptional regulator